VPINITIISTNDEPFIAKIYKSNGFPLKYKTNIIKYIGKIDYIEIENSSDKENNIVLQMSKMDKVRKLSVSSIIAILIVIIVKIVYEKKSASVKVLLFIFLIVQLYELPQNIEVSERVFKKLLF
jgi:hypothetical protein